MRRLLVGVLLAALLFLRPALVEAQPTSMPADRLLAVTEALHLPPSER